jgi:hypothetical protein
MAKKICSCKEKCVNGNVPQDYSNFPRWINSSDGHKGQCKDCTNQKRRDRVKKDGDPYLNQFKYFIG